MENVFPLAADAFSLPEGALSIWPSDAEFDGDSAWLYHNEAQLERDFKDIPDVAWDLLEATDYETVLELSGCSRPMGEQREYVAVVITRDQKLTGLIQRAKAPLLLRMSPGTKRIRLAPNGCVSILP